MNDDGSGNLYLGSEVDDKVLFDGSALKHSVGDQTVSYTPATQAQIEKYKAMADEWHGGAEQHVVDLSKMGSTYVARDGDVLTGKISNDKTVILVAPDATITLRNARIEYTKEGFDTHWAGLECEGNATIILEGSNYVRGADASNTEALSTLREVPLLPEVVLALPASAPTTMNSTRSSSGRQPVV